LSERLDLSIKFEENPSDCTFPLFNWEKLKAFLKKCKSSEDDPEFFLNVIDQFHSDLPRHLEGMKQTVEHQESDALVKMPHASKVSSGYMGARHLAKISFSLKTLGRQGTTLGVQDFFLNFGMNRIESSVLTINKTSYLGH
jgi:HPt (histidine-containing phosphotransfer) domain-containing protein